MSDQPTVWLLIVEAGGQLESVTVHRAEETALRRQNALIDYYELTRDRYHDALYHDADDAEWRFTSYEVIPA